MLAEEFGTLRNNNKNRFRKKMNIKNIHHKFKKCKKDGIWDWKRAKTCFILQN